MAALARRLRKSASVVRRARQRAVKPPPRFGRNEIVSGPVAQRTGARLAALGGSNAVKGVSGADGYTGREARLVLEARKQQKRDRPVGGLIDRPVRGRSPGTIKPRGGYGQPPRPDQSQAVRSRGIGAQVRLLAHDKSRTGGIGSQVRELAQRERQQRSLTGQLRARRRRAARARPRLVRY